MHRLSCLSKLVLSRGSLSLQKLVKRRKRLLPLRENKTISKPHAQDIFLSFWSSLNQKKGACHLRKFVLPSSYTLAQQAVGDRLKYVVSSLIKEGKENLLQSINRSTTNSIGVQSPYVRGEGCFNKHMKIKPIKSKI